MEQFTQNTFNTTVFLPRSPAEQTSNTEETQPASIQLAEVPQEHRLEPPAEGVFPSKENLLEHIRKHALSKGYAIAIQKSTKLQTRLYIGCDRGGTQRVMGPDSPSIRRRQKSSRKCGCPFRLFAKKAKDIDTWDLKIKHPFHNHPADEDMATHPAARRLTPEQRRHVKHLDIIGVKPKDIVTFLRLENPSALFLPRDISNELSKLRREKEAFALKEQILPEPSQDLPENQTNVLMFDL
ncbi:hypothetical protein N7507_001846 [Penicillium longicatenatum]|nr:hypothetical protein N7507_001846 [Penicillium longicatenatum]